MTRRTLFALPLLAPIPTPSRQPVEPPRPSRKVVEIDLGDGATATVEIIARNPRDTTSATPLLRVNATLRLGKVERNEEATHQVVMDRQALFDDPRWEASGDRRQAGWWAEGIGGEVEVETRTIG